MGDSVNSMCAILAILIEEQLRSDDPNMDSVFDNLQKIKENCATVATKPGETPDHLSEYLFDEGDAEYIRQG